MAIEDPDSYIPSLAEDLTVNFYRWERRGRGWQVWDYPVELEPPFKPFYHYLTLPPRSAIDDGRKPTFLGSMWEKFWKGEPQVGEAPSPAFSEGYYEDSPSGFFDDSPLRELRISLPAKQKIIPESAETFLLNLSYCSLPLSFEIIGSSASISVQMTCRESDLLQVRQQLQAYFPEAVIAEERDFLKSSWNERQETVIVDFGLSQEFMRPLRTFKSFEIDPLIGIIGALESLDEGEMGVFQVLFQAVQNPWSKNILKSVADGEGGPFFADAPEMLPLAKEKVRRPLFGVVIRVAGQSFSERRAWEIVKGLGSGLTQLAYPQSNELIPLTNEDYDDLIHQEDILGRQTHRGGMLLNSEELISLVHPPSISVRTGKLVRELRRTKAAPAIALGHQLVLGENRHQGKSKVVSVSPEQRLRHMHVVGATGTGKSTLLLNLIRQDIDQGLGVAVLDPHGDLIERVLGYIPENRFADVTLFDPADSEYPVGFNILSAHSEIEQNVLASDLVAIFKRFSTSWGDQMTSVLGNAILAFLESKTGGTLADLKRFLVEGEYRKGFLTTVHDPEVAYYWNKEFPLLKGNPQASILTRLDSFLRPKLIRNIVAQKEGLNFEDILNSKKIFLAKLAQGLIGEENAYLLGALIVSKLHQVVMARQAKRVSERENFFLYIDEFHNFITPSLAAILSGARKYHLGLILAHQELRQLWNRDTEVAHSVISNPGTRICFRLGDFDAQKLESGFSNFDSQDLQNLGIGEAIVRIERAEYDFNLRALPLPEIDPELAQERQEEIIRLSREQYGCRKEYLANETRPAVALTKPPLEEVTSSPPPAAPEAEIKAASRKERTKVILPGEEKKAESQHRYLQALIKRMAEEKGFRATIEQPTPDGAGRVDISLERNGKMIACEVSMTSTEEQELKNIEKCLKAKYDRVILCSPEKKFLERVKGLVIDSFPEADQGKLLFFQPEELLLFLEEEAAGEAATEERVKGYRVKVQYQPVKETEKKAKRQAVAQVILQALRRKNKEK
jgi:DNA helicase HerA-like ATPase